MAVEFQITRSKLEEVLKARIVAVRPCISNGIPFDAEIYHVAWLDIGDSEIREGTVNTTLILNELVNDQIDTPPTGGVPLLLKRLVLRQQITAQLCTRSAMKASNNDQAATIGVGLEIDLNVFIHVNTDGVPSLCVQFLELVSVDAPINEAAQAQVAQLLQTQVNSCIPLSLRPLRQVAGGETPRVFNGGIAATSDLSSVMIRFETEAPDAGALARWQSFYGGSFMDRLHGQEWALFVPKDLVESSIKQILEDGLADDKAFSLQSSVNVVWAPIGDAVQLLVTFQGEIIDACLDIDLDVDIAIKVWMSSPQANVLRTTIVVSWDGDFWEEVACEIVAALFWPIVGIVFIDEGKTNWWHYFGGLAVGPAVIFFGIVSYLSSDEPGSEIDPPADWVKDSNTMWHQDRPFPTAVGGITGLSLELAAADIDGLVLAGSINLQQPVVPTLKTFPHPFEWHLEKPCKSAYAYEAEASIGVVADPIGATPRLNMQLCHVDVFHDPANFYSDNDNIGPGAIGNSTSFNVRVKNPPAAFAANPYDLEVLIFSSQGCRMITIPAPDALPAAPTDPAEQQAQEIAWMAWKATHCWKFMNIWDKYGLMKPTWVIDPPPEEIYAQHWWVEIEGATQGDVVTIRDEVGRDLASVEAQANGRAQVSAILENASRDSGIWVARNGARLSANEFEAAVGRLTEPTGPPPGDVTIKQTLLQLHSELKIDGSLNEMVLDYHDGKPTLFVNTTEGRTAYRLNNPRKPAAVQIDADLVKVALGRAISRRSRFLNLRSARFDRGSRAKGLLLDAPAHLSPTEFTTTQSQPWYVNGARLGRLYALVSDSGSSVRIYQISASHLGHEKLPLPSEVFCDAAPR